MKFNYRDFFITNNDDLSIIKEQLSIVDEMVSRKDALVPNAKAVWDMYKKETSGTDGSSGSSGSSGTSGTDGSSGSNEPKIEQKIADKLKINLSTVQKIIQICLMNTVDKKNANTIANELGISITTAKDTLNNTLGSEREREVDAHFMNDAVKIYLHKDGKTSEEIVNLVNREKPIHFEKITVDDVNLIKDIVKYTEEQMKAKGEVNAREIHRKIGKKISLENILNLITNLNLGKIRYQHKFTEEQDAFILYLYLQRNGPTKTANEFNKKFKDPEGNALNITQWTIRRRVDHILKPNGESEISEYVLYLLNRYETEYFSAVDINDDETKKLLTHYTAPEKSTLKRKDYLRKYHSTRNIAGQGTAGTQYFDVGASDNVGPSRVIAKRLGGHSPTT